MEEKGAVEKATAEELVFRPIEGSPNSKVSDQDFTNSYYYHVEPTYDKKLKSKNFPNFKHL